MEKKYIRILLLVGFFIMGLAIIILFGYSRYLKSVITANIIEKRLSQEVKEEVIKAKYTVTGTAKTVNVTYQMSDGMSQKSDVPVPWEYSFETERYEMLILSAQNQGDRGSVIVTLYISGEQMQQVTSEGAFTIASTKGYIVE